MKIGDDLLRVSLKDRIKIVSLVITCYVLLAIALDWLFDRALDSWHYYLLKGVLFGFLFSAFFYFFIKYMTKRVALNLQIPLAEGEELEAYGVANLFLGKEAVGGKLGITETNLVFHSHKFNKSTGTVRIDFTQIERVKPSKIMWCVDNGLDVFVEGRVCRFVVNNRDQWLTLLKKKLEILK